MRACGAHSSTGGVQVPEVKLGVNRLKVSFIRLWISSSAHFISPETELLRGGVSKFPPMFEKSV